MVKPWRIICAWKKMSLFTLGPDPLRGGVRPVRAQQILIRKGSPRIERGQGRPRALQGHKFSHPLQPQPHSKAWHCPWSNQAEDINLGKDWIWDQFLQASYPKISQKEGTNVCQAWQIKFCNILCPFGETAVIREGGFLQNRGKIALFLPCALEGTKIVFGTKGVEISKSPS